MFWKKTPKTGYWEETWGLRRQEGGEPFSVSLLYLIPCSNIPMCLPRVINF